MSDHYRIVGMELSPYSVKVRSWFRFKQLPHQWILRNPASQEEYGRFARIPIIPLVVTPAEAGLQDSTPIIDRLEALHPQPSIHPEDATLAFLSAMIEEWGNKWMFHYRWARTADRLSASGRIARGMAPDADESTVESIAEQIRERMVSRVWFVGSNEVTAAQIESSFVEAITQLDRHLASRPYLFGARPSFGDFGLWGQLYNAWTDPTPGALIEGRTPNLLAWIQRMTWPRIEGDFEQWSSLAPTLAPFLTRQVGARFVPWTLANESAVGRGDEEFEVELDGKRWTQKPQKYHAKSLAALRERYSRVGDRGALDAILSETGCAPAFRA